MKAYIRVLLLLLLAVSNNAYGEENESFYDFTINSAIKRATGTPERVIIKEYRLTDPYVIETNSLIERNGSSRPRLRLAKTEQFTAMITSKHVRVGLRF